MSTEPVEELSDTNTKTAKELSNMIEIDFFNHNGKLSKREDTNLNIAIKSTDVYSLLAGVYQNGYPVILGQVDGKNTLSLLLSRRNMSLKGTATLKITWYDMQYRQRGYKIDFQII